MSVSSETRKWIMTVLGATAFVLVVSFVAGHIRNWRKDHPKPKPVPVQVDQGKPIERTVFVPVPVEVPVPVLEPAERKAAADKYEVPVPTGPGGFVPGSLTPDGEAIYPMLVAEERFSHEASGSSVMVSGWILCEGCPVDLRAVWDAYTAPQSPSDRYFQNVARFQWEAGAGLVMLGDGAGPGVLLAGRFRSVRLGKATLNASGVGLVNQYGGAGFAGLSVSWP